MGQQAVTRKTRIIDIAYNAYNNELGRTKTIVKNAIAVIDAVTLKARIIDIAYNGEAVTRKTRIIDIATTRRR